MHRIPWSSRLAGVLVIASLAFLTGTALGWLAGEIDAARQQRPPADAPVRVVKVPAEPVVDRLPACRTCEMGGSERRL